MKKLLEADKSIIADIEEEYQKYKEQWDKTFGNEELIKISNNTVSRTTIQIKN